MDAKIIGMYHHHHPTPPLTAPAATATPLPCPLPHCPTATPLPPLGLFCCFFWDAIDQNLEFTIISQAGWQLTFLPLPLSPSVQARATTHSCIEFFENTRDISWHSGRLPSSGKTNGPKQSGKRMVCPTRHFPAALQQEELLHPIFLDLKPKDWKILIST